MSAGEKGEGGQTRQGCLSSSACPSSRGTAVLYQHTLIESL